MSAGIRRRFGIVIEVAVFTLIVAAAGSAAAAQSFDIVNVAPGVYAAIGKNGTFGNGAFIVNSDGVIVIDTQARPSWARDLMAEIKKVTNKPVTTVVNTHFHGDHTNGNMAYVAAYGSSLTIIGQENMKADLLTKGAQSLATSRDTAVPQGIARMQQQLTDGKDAQGNALTPEPRQQLQTQLDSQKSYLEELKQVQITPPTKTYDRDMTLSSGGRTVRLIHVGNAHTRGDTIIFLPKERVVITGDLLTNGIPVMRNAYPAEWINTLDALDKLDFETAVPGHGDVQHGKAQLEKLISYMRDMVAGVKDAVAQSMTLEQTEAAVDLSKHKSDFPNFDASSRAAVDRAYLEATGKITD
jgi:glyoxylase-like metal-dependent hydrolase (beta-lactamase superfamily II)